MPATTDMLGIRVTVGTSRQDAKLKLITAAVLQALNIVAKYR